MLDILQSAAFYVVPFLLVLGLVVTVHELGHFWAARALGISVDRFSLGFGKAIALDEATRLLWRTDTG